MHFDVLASSAKNGEVGLSRAVNSLKPALFAYFVCAYGSAFVCSDNFYVFDFNVYSFDSSYWWGFVFGFFFRVLTVFTVLLEVFKFGWYAFLDRFDSFECYGFVLGFSSVFTVLIDMILFLVDFRYDFFVNEWDGYVLVVSSV